MLAHMASDTL